MRAYIPDGKSHDTALWRFAGLPPRGLELTRMLEAGLPVAVIDDIRHWSAMSRAEIMKVTGINERNIARRKSAGKSLSPDESERIARFVRVMDAAVQLFGGNKEDATQWLSRPVKGLGNIAPITLLATESGALDVLDLIGRLEHGVFS
jgi:putative toxin-antitoxin system antitoxin component (TIGR02293 family)